jgi:hypothetical protein
LFFGKKMRNRNKLVSSIVAISVFTAMLGSFDSVNADPIAPQPYPNITSLGYVLVVILSELIAWIVGAEALLRLLARLKGQEKESFPRTIVYFGMLISMLVSLFVGFLLWYLLS